ncbi:hypothetical protein [Vibrio hippocampi]|uniref:MSHA biogenesis protein MshP n=1 Tax=Vibrio hippocampi TaxID=654686 RepID=A0ABN8DEL0_9VIBR|nr:hypothetical protein [Vibrio hippocampi]CAH0524924.1 hypothetical protein VHP8226_00600 [Vibrio hippocampi]
MVSKQQKYPLFRHRGLALLLTCVLMLLIASSVLIATHQNAYFESKRVGNEVLSRQRFWLANSSVECAIAVLNGDPNALLSEHDFTRCHHDDLPLQVTPTGQGYQISIQINHDSVIAMDTHLVKTGTNDYWMRGSWRDF